MSTWITADWHLGEDRFQIMQRPGFESAEHMINVFVEEHNKLVAPDDEVFVIGDVVNQSTPEYLKEVSRFNGRKTLLRGNHDRVFSDSDLTDYFEKVIPEATGITVRAGDQIVYLNHYPSLAIKDHWNLVGHIHAAWKVQLNSINVGVDANHYRPHNLDVDIPFYINAITKFYDQDVWAAYNEANQSFSESRGAKGTYWEKNQ